jgi:thioredoxin-related protein
MVRPVAALRPDFGNLLYTEHTMKNIKTIAVGLVLMITGSSALAAGGGWLTDFQAAQAAAKASGKYMLVDFTGSDWCGWCIKLKDEVFSKDHFKTEAPKNFVLVELDFPRAKDKLSPKLIAQNKKLRDTYAIRGFPTILIMNASGNVLAKTGYRAGGPEKYIEHLNSLLASQKAFKKMLADADKAKGLKKAKLLDKAISSMPDSTRKSRSDLVKQIIELDKDNKAGLKTKYAFLAATDELTNLRLPRTRDQAEIKAFAAKALDKIAAIEKKYPVKGAEKQKLLSQKAMFTFYSGDLAGSKLVLEEAIAIDDKSAVAKSMKNSLAFVTKRLAAEKKSKAEK